MSPLWTAILTALGGALAGFAGTAGLLHRQLIGNESARRQAADADRRASHYAELAYRDDTTGLSNRRAFLENLTRALAAAEPLGVVLIDLDGFKAVNDTHGHRTGNDLLTAVGYRLCDLRPPVLLAARLSGDEFALLIQGDERQAAVCARTAWRAITGSPTPIPDGGGVWVQASVGFATAGPGQLAEDLLHEADVAMYQAKQAGSGVYQPPCATLPTLPRNTRYRDARRHS